MTALDLKGVGDLVKTIGPTDEDRQRFGRTFFGSLMGQATVLVGLMVIYVAAIVLLWKYAFDELRALHAAIGAIAFWALIATPILFILLFSMLPTAWRALRERRLKAKIISGESQFKPGYFRLHPYSEVDRDIFKRLDGAEAAILAWLKATKTSLLYLSGASGVGKSSVLAANVLPHLRDSGWTVISARLFSNPIEQIRSALLASDSGLAKDDYMLQGSLRKLLEDVVESSKQRGAAPLLLVIDQFEEFLILHNEKDRSAFAEFLSELARKPIDNFHLLLVFRSDYRALVFKYELPPLVARQSWQELAPYDRGEAATFLQSGGRKLSSDAIDALFRGLDRIEEAQGIYRPITLNMVGLVLERMGRTLEGDPGRLIQTYLMSCLTTSASRDFIKQLLAYMITEAGTKEPRSERDLATCTGFESWQVKSTLADLADKGLVRRLESAADVWEVSHDFLARIIGQLIGRLRPTAMQRVRPLIAPVVLLGWVALAALALPYWITTQERASEAALRAAGATLKDGKFGGMLVDFPSEINDDTLRALAPHIARISRVSLDLSSSEITNVEPLNGFTNIHSLDLRSSSRLKDLHGLRGMTNLAFLNLNETEIENIDPLAELVNLRSLSLGGNTVIRQLEPLRNLKNLGSLDLSGMEKITNIEALKSLLALTSLDLSDATGISSLAPLMSLTNLSSLDLSRATRITDLEPLRALTNLSSLNLSGTTGITSLEPLKGLRNLTSLDLSSGIGSSEPSQAFKLSPFSNGVGSAVNISDLEPIKGLISLTLLDLSGQTRITSLEPLAELSNLTSLSLARVIGIKELDPIKGLSKLTSLDLSGATGITNLEPLRGLRNLSSLNLEGVTGISSLEPLREMTNLISLRILMATGITTLAPLRGKVVVITGASDQLRATMR